MHTHIRYTRLRHQKTKSPSTTIDVGWQEKIHEFRRVKRAKKVHYAAEGVHSVGVHSEVSVPIAHLF